MNTETTIGQIFDPKEQSLILAALRCFEQVRAQCSGDLTEDLLDIATNSGKHDAPESDDIDDLFDRFSGAPLNGAAIKNADDAKVEAEGAPIHRYLDLSTAHLDEDTGRAMADGHMIPDRDDDGVTVVCLSINSRDDGENFGHIVPVLAVEEGEDDWPQCMRDCLARARALNCDYIRFDRDGQIDAALPTYDLEGSSASHAASDFDVADAGANS